MTLRRKSAGFFQFPATHLHLSGNALKIYGYINARSNIPDWDFAIERIAKDVYMSVKTCREAIKQLEESGLLRRVRLRTGRMDYQLMEPIQSSESDFQTSDKSDCSEWDKVVDNLFPQ